MRARRLPAQLHCVSRGNYTAVPAPPGPSPALASVSTLFPGVALFPTIRSHFRPPIPVLPASAPGVWGPSDVRKPLRGEPAAALPSNRACLPRLPRSSCSAPITVLAKTPSAPVSTAAPAEICGGAPPAHRWEEGLGPELPGRCSQPGPPCARAHRDGRSCWQAVGVPACPW